MSSTQDLRSPRRKVEFLGTAKSGTHHWIAQRLTAAALIPLVLYVLYGFITNVVDNGYGGVHYWLGNPLPATFSILFLLSGLYHGAIGLQVVIEDYIHCECAKLSLIFVTYFCAAALAILGTLSVAKIFFGV